MLERLVAASMLPPTYFPEFFDIRAYEPGDAFRLGGFAVRTMQTVHPVVTSAFHLTDQHGHIVVLTSDTGPCPGLADFARGADLLVIEVTDWPDVAHPRCHLQPEEAGDVIAHSGVTRAVVTHYDARFADEILAAVREAGGGVDIKLAAPHQVLEVG